MGFETYEKLCIICHTIELVTSAGLFLIWVTNYFAYMFTMTYRDAKFVTSNQEYIHASHWLSRVTDDG